MSRADSHPVAGRRRLLITAYHYDRAYSMESRLSWQRAQHAASQYDVTVITARPEIDPIGESQETGSAVHKAIEVFLLPLNRVERLLMSLPGCYYLGYRLWFRRVFRLSQRLHAERPFALVHHVSFCGYREPSDGWKLGVPFIWGPIGGTQLFPASFLGQVDALGALRELARNAANYCQLRGDPRVRRAALAAAKLLAANQHVARDLTSALGIRSIVELETGIEQVDSAPREQRDRSRALRILWSGRLQSWKGLPLLLRALADLPADCRYQLRVMGQGPCLRRWQRLASRLGVAANIEWIGWPEYASQLPHYRWADVFAFTSLRDTSGTGLLEALAAGAPIIGVNHQGAADIMTSRCAIAVNPTLPAAAINGFRDAVLQLATDSELLHTMSASAIDRAAHFTWDRHWRVMQTIYEDALASAASATRPSSTHVQSPPNAASCLVGAF